MATKALPKMGELSLPEDLLKALPEEIQRAVENLETDEGYVKALKGIRNDIEQIHEIGQSLTVVSREIADELIKVLQLNNRPLKLEDFDEDRDIVVHPRGFVLIQDGEGDVEPRLLVDLEPALLHAVLRRLIPALKESLDKRKRKDEGLLEELIKTRDPLV